MVGVVPVGETKPMMRFPLERVSDLEPCYVSFGFVGVDGWLESLYAEHVGERYFGACGDGVLPGFPDVAFAVVAVPPRLGEHR